MPSKKPIIHFNTEQWIIDKMKHIAEENSRSLAKEMEYLCKTKIKEYEAEHGEIKIEPSSIQKAIEAQKKTIRDRKENGTIKTLAESWNNGLNTFKKE